ncbi:MAG: IS21 family transposase [bacterium]|nr:IS21 family transposase [bacterium]
MSAQRVPMHKVREVLRLRLSAGLCDRQIARCLKISPTTVGDYLKRAESANLRWPQPEDLDDDELERRLFPPPPNESRPESPRPLPEWGYIAAELRRKHVTLTILWQEYKDQYPDGYQYSQFCEYYHRFAKKIDVAMRQTHHGGEKLFVDYSGDGIPWFDPHSRQWREAALFVAALGASSRFYAEATETETLPDWIASHVNAFEYFGGVTTLIVPDQCRTAVKRPCYWDPDINATYADMARHFGTTVVPARPRRPKDKAKAENCVLLAQRWIIAALRHRTFYSVAEINAAIRELLVLVDQRKMRKLGLSRLELFEKLDRPALSPLPTERYEFTEWTYGVRVNLDYHVAVDSHDYSVPYQLAHKHIDVCASRSVVEFFHKHRRVASHPRSDERGGVTTDEAHMPVAHRKHRNASPSTLIERARRIGASTAELLETILTERPHPEQGYRACLGILSLAKRYGDERLERACFRALVSGCRAYGSLQSILKKGLDSEPLEAPSAPPLGAHENIRGSSYYN